MVSKHHPREFDLSSLWPSRDLTQETNERLNWMWVSNKEHLQLAITEQ